MGPREAIDTIGTIGGVLFVVYLVFITTIAFGPVSYFLVLTAGSLVVLYLILYIHRTYTHPR